MVQKAETPRTCYNVSHLKDGFFYLVMDKNIQAFNLALENVNVARKQLLFVCKTFAYNQGGKQAVKDVEDTLNELFKEIRSYSVFIRTTDFAKTYKDGF